MPIDTGTGGFSIDGDLYTYDTGVPEDQGGSQGQYSSGDIKKDNTKKDLTKKTKERLSKYLSDSTSGTEQTNGVPNNIPVSPGYSEINLSADQGNPTPIKFPDNQEGFEPALNSYYSEQFPEIATEFKKGKSSANIPDGNDLLIKADTETSKTIKKYTSAVLKNNRFQPIEENSNLPPFLQVSYPDTENVSPYYNPTVLVGLEKGSSKGGESVSSRKMMQVGPALMMRATSEILSNDQGFDPSSTVASSIAVLPGTSQLGVTKVKNITLQTKDILKQLADTEVPTDNIIDIGGSDSWGSLNNPSDKFSGMDALGMIPLSAALVASLEIIIESLGALLNLISPQTKNPTRDTLGRYALGRYYSGQKKDQTGGLLGTITSAVNLDIASLVGINPTIHSFGECLRTGARAFFGLKTDNPLGAIGLAVADSFGQDAGFNAVVCRAIVRSSYVIIDYLSKIGSNPIDAVEKLLAFVDLLKSSKVINACNVFAQLGDALLSVQETSYDKNVIGPGLKVSSMDAYGNLNGNAASKNRLQNSLKLAWASNRAPALYLLPSNIGTSAIAAKELGSFDPSIGVLSDLDSRAQSHIGTKANGWRIPQDVVDSMEKMLDAEYVPFYFHDVRTNEIISFHAFLTSLTDEFAPNYESGDYYGRVEPVKIYKSTARKMAMSFYLVSTSLPDFDAMWNKINKLVTLVYPQYTAGKKLQDKDGKYLFTQPFSQLIGASPLVRIRLGDMWKTNYSRFGLARLFGLGDPTMKLDNKVFTDIDKLTQADYEKLIKAFLESVKTPSELTFIPQGNSPYPLYNDPTISVNFSGKPQNALMFWQTGVPDFFQVRIEKILDNQLVVCKVEVNEEADFGGMDINAQTIKQQYDNPSEFQSRYIGGRYVIPLTMLRPTKYTIDKIVGKAISAKTDEFAQLLSTFLKEDGQDANAIAKSFKEVGGKGIAGTIDSLGFDWNDNVTWEVSPGRTAPKMCKITVSFSPIHDISPGIDHMGYNRAPVYPVGTMSQRAVPVKNKKS